MKTKENKMTIGLEDFIFANRRASREVEMELVPGGWRSRPKIHKSKKTYSRKEKHKNAE